MSEDIDKTSRTKLSEVRMQQGWLERSMDDLKEDVREVKTALSSLSSSLSSTLSEIKTSLAKIPALEDRIKSLEDDVGQIKLSQAKFVGFLTAAGTLGGGAGAVLAKLLGVIS